MRLDPTTRPRYAKISLRTDCPRCGSHLPVNAPVTGVECDECGHGLTVDPELYRDVLALFEQQFPDEVRQTRITGDQTWKVVALPFAAPPCPTCDGTLALPAEDVGQAQCPSCGTDCTVGAPPLFLKEGGPQRVLLPTAPDVARDASPVALNCPGCGAGLTVGADDPRLTTCTHCSTQVHLPELVWRRFHPKRTVTPWIARFDGESKAAQALAAAARRRQTEAENAERRRQQQEENAARNEKQNAARKAQQDRERAQQQQAEREQVEAARLARAEAEANEHRWNLWTSPLVVLSLLFALSACGAMASGVLVDVWHAVTPAWRISKSVGVAAELFPMAMSGWGLSMWAGCVLLACIRTREGLGLFFWSTVMLVVSHIPLVGWALGLFWSVQHLRNLEPTMVDGRVVPRFTGIGLAVLLATLPLYDFVVFAFLLD